MIHGKADSNPFTTLLQGLSGLEKKLKLLAGWQHWSKSHFDQHKVAFETQFKESGADKKYLVTAHQAYIRDYFHCLPEDVRQLHNQAASAKHAAALQALEEKKTSPPSDSQIDCQM